MLMLMIMTKNNYHDAKLAEKCNLTIVQHMLIVDLCAIKEDTCLGKGAKKKGKKPNKS